MIRRTPAILAAWMLCCFCANVAEAKVIAEIVRVGFPSVGGIHQGRDLARSGAWTPIEVDLRIEGQPSLEGWLRLSAADKDGDLCVDRQRVQLLAEQTNTRRYTLYTLAGHQANFTIELIDDNNNRIQVETRGAASWEIEPAMRPETLHDNDYLVLSVSSETAGKIVDLQDISDIQTSRPVLVAHMAPFDLPTLWLGLEAVDAIVWDDADPADLSIPQTKALIEWTRQGGTLVISSTDRTVELTKSAFAELLPVRLGDVAVVDELPKTLRLMGSSTSFPAPVPVVACTLKEGAVAVVSDPVNGVDVPIVSRHLFGRGRVSFVAAKMRQVFRDENANVKQFFIRVLELREEKSTGGGTMRVLFSEMDKWVGFSQVGALYLALALVFVAGYVLVSTFGSWAFLRQKKWTKHSWSTFAVLAGACCFLSVIGVQSVRGVGRKLLQLSVVDAQAGSSAAQATSYYGLKTSVFGKLDVWLPQDYPREDDPDLINCMLKPMPPIVTVTSSPKSFIDPARYSVKPSAARILDVPIRGTVKQFEGRWSGYLSGRVLADIRLEQGASESNADVRVAANSTITNNLGVDIDHAYLVYSASDTHNRNGWVPIPRLRSQDTYVIPIGRITEGETVMPAQTAYVDKSGVELAYKDWSRKLNLDDILQRLSKQWGLAGGALTGLPEGWRQISRLEAAMFLATMFEEYYPEQRTSGMGQFSEMLFSLAHCRQLEIGGLVDRNNALLIAVTDAPGPAPLCVGSGDDFERVEPTDAYTMYRIRIPVVPPP